ncbi:acyl carrier protein [Microbacterium sp. NPDC076768]|uniref:acyl carrier protein n=1 Tax=Microbacterium sp. NPDC076768 TaxID=3154858 RepID=UPI0034379E0C
MEISALDVIDSIRATMDDLSHMGPDDPFVDLDIDSLSLVEAAVVLSTRFGVRIDEFELSDAGNARAVASKLTEKLALSTT